MATTRPIHRQCTCCQRPLAPRLRDPSRLGRRVVYVAAFAVGYLLFSLVGYYGLGCVVLLVFPAFFGAALGRAVTDLRLARKLRRSQRTPPGLRRLRRA